MKVLGVLVTVAAMILGLALQVSAGPAAREELDPRDEDQIFVILLPHQDFSLVLPPQGQE